MWSRTASTPVSADADFTCRVLVGGLKPASLYWYRFSDPDGNGSRIGRTITAPAANDPRPVSFAFVSCQNAKQGAQNAYRRMIFEDERAGESDRLSFVLHLGDFIYEIVWYPEDRPQGMYDRRLRDIVRYASGEKIHDFHIPTTLDDYRAVYRAYLRDPDLQDARARWPFVNMWDNHEFSWLGWQSLQKFYGETRPAQTRKVAANQAFFEFQPARMARPHAGTLERFDGPHVENAPITAFDAHGLGQEPNNLAAIASLKGYRALRWGRHVELIRHRPAQLLLRRAERRRGGQSPRQRCLSAGAAAGGPERRIDYAIRQHHIYGPKRRGDDDDGQWATPHVQLERSLAAGRHAGERVWLDTLKYRAVSVPEPAHAVQYQQREHPLASDCKSVCLVDANLRV
jgi:hypothetical protein